MQAQAVGAVQQALRHADMPAGADIERIQHEPFEANGKRAEVFTHGPPAAAWPAGCD